jgi:hypothetical protein
MEIRAVGCASVLASGVAAWLPRHPAGFGGGGRAHLPERPLTSATCRVWWRRQGGAGFGPGGTCHVSPGPGCRHSQVVFFDKIFQRWSFLSFHWCRWSLLSKIRQTEASYIASQTCALHILEVHTISTCDLHSRSSVYSSSWHRKLL